MPTLTFFIFAAISLASATSWAQVIDLFDGQDKMDTKAVQVGTVGEVNIESGQAGIQTDGGITIRFERKDHSIMVPAKIRGKSVYFLFDTGATYTTLTSAFARSVGLLPKKDYPVGMSQTANGPKPSMFGLIDRITLGGRPHSNVTFSICDACPSGIYKGRPIVGLLGLNVVGRYRYSIDEGAGKIEMYPHSNYGERLRDVQPWLQMVDQKQVKSGNSEFTYKVIFKNLAPVSIISLDFLFKCSNGKSFSVKKSISSHSKTTFSKTLKTDACPGMRYDFASARW